MNGYQTQTMEQLKKIMEKSGQNPKINTDQAMNQKQEFEGYNEPEIHGIKFRDEPNKLNRESIELIDKQLEVSIKKMIVSETESNFFARSKGKSIIIDEVTKGIMKIMYSWMVGEFEGKGVMIIGPYGLGKSVIMKTVLDLSFNLFGTKHPDEVETYKPMFCSSKTLQSVFQDNQNKKKQELYNRPILMIDDLGYEESKIQVYGNNVTPFANVLTHRYDKRKNIFITTNLSLKQIGEKYGSHIEDRLREMCEILEITSSNKSKR